MRTEFHPDARRDFEEAFDWYTERNPEAASRFAAEVDHALAQIERSPERFAKCDARHHRCLLERFPYHIVYRIQDDIIVVVAIAHGARRPRYWRKR